MMPIKDNLRSVIQNRRVARGLEELHIGKDDRKNDEKLSTYEQERRRIRRERNKEAANKCRLKRRQRLELLEKTAMELQDSNKMLEVDITNMREEIKELLGFLERHRCNISS